MNVPQAVGQQTVEPIEWIEPQQIEQIEWDDRTVNVTRLGEPIDGWHDVIEGEGNNAAKIADQIYHLLIDRGISEDKVQKGFAATGRAQSFIENLPLPKLVKVILNYTANLVSPERALKPRPYIFVSNSRLATTTIYVGNYGKDLYVSWRSYVGDALNLKLLSTIFFSIVFAVFFGSLIPFFAYIFLAMYTLAFSFALFSGYMHGYLLYHLFVEPNIFDVDDVTALNTTIQKCIIAALDTIGIDSTTVRAKEGGFYGKATIYPT